MINPFLIISIAEFIGLVFAVIMYLRLWKYGAEDQARLHIEQRKNTELEKTIQEYDKFLKNNCGVSWHELKKIKSSFIKQ